MKDRFKMMAKKIIAMISCAVISAIGLLAGWKLCQDDNPNWFWFVLVGVIAMLMEGGISTQEE